MRTRNTHGFLLKRQPPVCQRIPVATTDRSGWTQCQAEKTGSRQRVGKTTKKRRANLERNPEHVAQQRGGLSGQHLADFATLPSAVVKVARAYRYGHLAIVCTIEKVLPRGKNSENLDCLVQKLARTWWQRCHTSTFGNPERVKCITESMTARIVDFNRRHLKQGVLGGMAVGRRRTVMQSK